MKNVWILVVFSLLLLSCHNNEQKIKNLKNQVEQLNEQLSAVYKPGYGEIMESIQVYHAKLWFAGKNKNWKLAKFEVHELIENLESLEKFQENRVENGHLSMIYPVLDSLKLSLNEKNLIGFKMTYQSLTNTCNTCHKLTHYEYIQIGIPKVPCISNQVFEAVNSSSIE